ncbi:MAG: VWA domain-containing protein [Thiohalocapsa sp. PB-PSB1]|nr:MAG: VWA domain-containing protein [Thiohalocapsa sp. PB-PSB1]
MKKTEGIMENRNRRIIGISILRSIIYSLFLAILLPLLGTGDAIGSTTSLEIKIPKRGSGSGSMAIYQVEATMIVDGTGTVEFRVTDPENKTADFTLDSSTVCVGGDPATDPCAHEFPFTGNGNDSVKWEVPAVGVYKLTINPNSNTEFSGGECVDTMPVEVEKYRVKVLSGPEITDACLVSYDLSASGSECFDLGPPIQTIPLATINIDPNDGSALDQFCRPGVDSALVLDKSGSMNSSPMAGPSAKKIDALIIAANGFVNRWNLIREDEGTSPDDNIGVILFDSNESWLGDASTLDSFAEVAPSISGDMALVEADGSTSIGDGLFTASSALFDGPLATNGNRKTILLMSDGKENTHRRVRLWDNDASAVLQWSDIGTIAAADFQSRIKIQLGSDSTSWTDLANESNLRIYAVTVGSSTAVSAEINQGLAMATGGFYINSETNADILPAYFIELLQNFVKFNTWNVVALRSVSIGVDDNGVVQTDFIDFPLASTSQATSIDLSWNAQFGHVCLDVLAPGAKEEEKETVCSNQDDQAAGTLSWTKNLLTADPPVDTSGKWRATIRPMSGGAPFGLVNLVDYVPDAVEFPVFLTIMAEDSNVGSDYSIGVDDYVPGSEIPLHVKLKESGKALVGGVSVSALVASPDQSIGDLLAASSAGTSQPGNCPGGCDTDTDADTKLANELSENEEALARVENTVTLLDNGNSENGDQVAGDGIYSALYQVDAPGHYNVLFKTSGTTERSGDVMREQLMSLVVRNQPDADKTDIDTHISSDPKSRRQILNMTFKPATKGGHLMGPGWANYFWFTGPEITPFKATDNLDGTYSVAVSFYGWKIPDLTLHFLDVAQAIEDSTTHDKLPAPLGDSTALSDVTEQPPCKWYDLTCGMARLKYLILIILVLLIVFLLFRKHSGN